MRPIEPMLKDPILKNQNNPTLEPVKRLGTSRKGQANQSLTGHLHEVRVYIHFNENCKTKHKIHVASPLTE